MFFPSRNCKRALAGYNAMDAGASDAERMFDRAQLLERPEEPRRSLSALAFGMTVTSLLIRLVSQRSPLSKEV